MKMILKECKDEYGYKGGDSIQGISRLKKSFKRLMMEFVMESFKANIFSKI
jgi:hypothetical protein